MGKAAQKAAAEKIAAEKAAAERIAALRAAAEKKAAEAKKEAATHTFAKLEAAANKHAAAKLNKIGITKANARDQQRQAEKAAHELEESERQAEAMMTKVKEEAA